MDTLVDIDYEDEEPIISLRIAATIQHMLSVKNLTLPKTREETRISIRRFDQQVRELQEARLGPHTWKQVHDLCTKRAAYELLCWRMFPINDLPLEIIERIFLECIATLSAESVFKERLKLMSVCHHWLTTIVDAPQIWQTVYINSHPPFQLARRCIERAKSHQLKFYIDLRDSRWAGGEEENRFSSEHSDELMTFLAPYMSRVCLFVTLCDTWSVMLSVMRVLETMDAPQGLKRLELHRSGRPYVRFVTLPQPSPGFTVPIRLFGNQPLPSLAHVMMNGVFVDYSNFRNLRILEMAKMPVEHMPTFDTLAQVLRSSPLLERLQFNGTCAQLEQLCEEGSRYENWKPIPLPHLVELLIINLNSSYAIFATKIIDAPNVRHLTVGNMPEALDAQQFIMHLVDRYPRVRILTVEGMMCDFIGANALFLMSMPLLRYLKLGNVHPSFFNALLLEESDEDGFMSLSDTVVICPLLEALHVSDWNSLGTENIKRIWEKRDELGAPISDLLVPVKELEKLNEQDMLWARQTRGLSQVPANCRPELNERYWMDDEEEMNFE